MKTLSLNDLKICAGNFVRDLSSRDLPELFGTTDGKAVGTYVEHAFHDDLQKRFNYEVGSSASGIDFPSLGVDLNVHSPAAIIMSISFSRSESIWSRIPFARFCL